MYVFKLFTVGVVWFCILTSGAWSQADTRLPCNLEWLPLSAGASPPEIAVQAQGSQGNEPIQYVIRALMNADDRTYLAGRYILDLNAAFIPEESENQTATQVMNFQVLTNPSECRIAWTTADAKFRVQVADSSALVGRVQSEEELAWLPGHVYTSTGTIAVAVDDETEIYRTKHGIQFLISYSNGLEFIVEDVQFEEDMTNDSPEFLSMEELHNLTPATVTHKIANHKSIMERVTVTVSETYISVQTKTFGFDVFFYGKKKSERHEYVRTTTTTVTTETTTNVTTVMDLSIAPYTSVRVCTVVDMKSNFSSAYTAFGRYHAPGLDGPTVLALLRSEGVPGVELGSDGLVRVPVVGELAADIALTTRFIVATYEEDNEDVCLKIRKSSAQKKWAGRHG